MIRIGTIPEFTTAKNMTICIQTLVAALTVCQTEGTVGSMMIMIANIVAMTLTADLYMCKDAPNRKTAAGI